MAMNPDTNRMEQVFAEALSPEAQQRAENMVNALDATRGQLYRADGSTVPEHWSVFTLGETVTIKGYMFRVAYLGETSILLEPVGPVVRHEEDGR